MKRFCDEDLWRSAEEIVEDFVSIPHRRPYTKLHENIAALAQEQRINYQKGTALLHDLVRYAYLIAAFDPDQNRASAWKRRLSHIVDIFQIGGNALLVPKREDQ